MYSTHVSYTIIILRWRLPYRTLFVCVIFLFFRPIYSGSRSTPCGVQQWQYAVNPVDDDSPQGRFSKLDDVSTASNIASEEKGNRWKDLGKELSGKSLPFSC